MGTSPHCLSAYSPLVGCRRYLEHWNQHFRCSRGRLDMNPSALDITAQPDPPIPGTLKIQCLHSIAHRHPLLGTKTQGYQKRELSDPWVPAQLWIIFPRRAVRIRIRSRMSVPASASRTVISLSFVLQGRLPLTVDTSCRKRAERDFHRRQYRQRTRLSEAGLHT